MPDGMTHLVDHKTTWNGKKNKQKTPPAAAHLIRVGLQVINASIHVISGVKKEIIKSTQKEQLTYIMDKSTVLKF